ncbi:MAG: TonB-dependent receptor plug domain-containing protein [Bacteroidota bacterium]
MKLVTVILLASFMQVSAKSFGQLITFSQKNVTLERVFREVRKQAGYDVLLSTDKINVTAKIDADFKNSSIEEVMTRILLGKNLTFIVDDKTVFVRPKEKSVIDKVLDYFQDLKVNGKVTDKSGGTMSGVGVREKGTPNAVSTNAKGEFTISVKQGAVLTFSYVGYKTVERLVDGSADISVSLEEDASDLQQVNIVSTGYQDLNKKLFTGAATSLKASDVKRDGITDISRMLEGRVAGVSVQNVSGTFGAAPKIRVRGATSISGDNKPLWVVDGIILEDVVNISNEQLSTGDPSTLIGSSVAGLNPDDIESFNILKDAAATAQYGARAMNGVVVITTKKGKNTEGNPVVSYTGNFSTYMKPSYNNFDILNSADQMNVYLEMLNKGWLNHASSSRSANGGIFTKMYNEMYNYDPNTDTYALKNDVPSEKQFLQRYANANTDWFDVLFKQSIMQEHSIGISSGTKR